jgi:phage FluMu protein Com
MSEYRCRRCGRLLFRAEATGRVEIACTNRQCGIIQTIPLAKVGAVPSAAPIG